MHLWELTTHIVHAGTPQGVERNNAVLFVLTVNLCSLLTAWVATWDKVSVSCCCRDIRTYFKKNIYEK